MASGPTWSKLFRAPCRGTQAISWLAHGGSGVMVLLLLASIQIVSRLNERTASKGRPSDVRSSAADPARGHPARLTPERTGESHRRVRTRAHTHTTAQARARDPRPPPPHAMLCAAARRAAQPMPWAPRPRSCMAHWPRPARMRRARHGTTVSPDPSTAPPRHWSARRVASAQLQRQQRGHPRHSE